MTVIEHTCKCGSNYRFGVVSQSRGEKTVRQRVDLMSKLSACEKCSPSFRDSFHEWKRLYDPFVKK